MLSLKNNYKMSFTSVVSVTFQYRRRYFKIGL